MHNPLQVAESYAMADVVSNGRLDFGIGRGNAPREFQGMGVRFDDSWDPDTLAEALDAAARDN